MPDVQTVRGPVPAERLGPTLTHEHLVVSSTEFARDYPDRAWPGGRDAALATVVARLREVHDRGIRTIVDCTALHHGRDTAFVVEANAAVPDLNVVVSTGIYTDDYLPFYIKHRPKRPGVVDVLTELFVTDLVEGIGHTGVRAQNIKVMTDTAGVTANNERILRAAAQAAMETGAPITTHTHAPARNGLAQQAIFAQEGLDLAGVVIGHSGDSTDLDYLRALMDAGSVIASDRFGLNGAGRATEEQRIATIARLCGEGYGDRIVLSHDCLMACDWLDSFDAYPATWVPTHVSDVVLPALREAGVDEKDLKQMMVTTPARLLARNSGAR
ncbi:phosphotriesterase-related protein [Actinomycetospora endophytica]|uniref:Phosphotriesterase-related protein n=1 Tax=Actinomycetospora endophytica TaxID=2291215 RepID=A0ABS8PAQ3_9PSEU|nr:phosphotriesterase-related protein [Actinomycetospora endophytica]MCD2195103.1 phosphotriesterase-related protein [Actinomycetospora endophytica]